MLPLFHVSFFHYPTSGRIERLNEEVEEVKASRSEVLSEKKKLREKFSDLQKVVIFAHAEVNTVQV